MVRTLPWIGLSPRRALIGLFVGFTILAISLVLVDSMLARGIVAVCGLGLLTAAAWFVLQRQFDSMFDVLSRVGDDGLPAPLKPEETPKFGPLAAAVASREQRGQRLRDLMIDLRETSERLALTLEVATEGLYEIHFEPGNAAPGKGRYFVSGMGLFGVPADELVERNSDELNAPVRPDHKYAFQKAAIRHGHTDEVYSVDLQVQNRHGQWRWMSIRGRTLEWVDGDPVRILGVMTDITDRKELEHRAAHSDTMRSLGHLVSGLTHDLSNILAVVRANSDLMADFDVSKADVKRLAGTTREMAEDGYALLDGLLRLTPDAHTESTVELDRLASVICESLREIAPTEVRIEVHADHANSLVRGDRARLDQVVLNLGLNAIDSVGERGQVLVRTQNLNLRVKNRFGLASGAYVSLEVSDDGAGIDPTVLDTLFEPFVTTKRAGMGTGLGLATSFDTVSHAGGTMYATNNSDGRGATFTVLLPLAEESEREADGSHEASSVSQKGSPVF